MEVGALQYVPLTCMFSAHISIIIIMSLIYKKWKFPAIKVVGKCRGTCHLHSPT